MKVTTKIKVKDLRNLHNRSMEYADLVTCCNCGLTMLVNLGTDSCPECGEHALSWTEPDMPEVNESYMERNRDKYLLVGSCS